MSIFRSGKTVPVANAQPDFSGLAIQTATAAAAIPIVYGTTRVAPNIIWRDGAVAIPQYTTTRSGGSGKGGGGGTQTSVSGYDYVTWIEYAIGEGPVVAVNTIYSGQAVYAYGAYNLGLVPGTTPQTPWSPAQSSFPAAALNYNGTAYMASSDFDLGSSASLPSIAFEVFGLLQATAQTVNAYDCDPAQVINDLLTNPQYGVGFPPASLDATTLYGASGDASYQSYCKAAGLAFSPQITDQEAASSILTRWLQLTNTAAIWSGGKLKFVPYGDSAVAGASTTTIAASVPLTPEVQVVASSLFVSDGGVSYAGGGALTVNSALGQGQYTVAGGLYSFSSADEGAQVMITFTSNPISTYTPNTTPIYDLTDDDFVYENGNDPIEVARLDPYAVPNVQRLECFDRSNQYAATPIEARDQNAIEQFGLNIGSTITAHEICDLGIGLTSAQLILQRGLYIRNTYSFKLSWEYCLLEPMDLVTLTDPGLGLAKTIVRITLVEEDDTGLLAVTAEEFPGSTATAAGYTVPANQAKPLNRNVAPASVNAPLVFEPPAQLTGGTPQIWAAVSGGVGAVADPNWGGANVWMSTDGTSFTQVGQVVAPARQGVTTAALPAFAGSNPDTANTLAVDLGESGGVLSSVTQTDAANAVTLAIVDSELVSYMTATLTATGRYALTTLYRGLYGSVPVAHGTDARFARLDNAVFKYTLPSAYIGTTLTLKFQSFNIWGGGVQDLSTCAAYTIKLIGSGLFGPTAQEIATGTSFDESLASQPATQTDDYGLASDPYTDPLDEGFASDLAVSLAVASGGTGSASATGALANLGAAATGANSDITSLAGLTTPLSVAQGGTAASTATAARSVLAAAAAGANADITSLLAVLKIQGGSTQSMTIDPATGHVGLAGYTADANNALGVSGTACLFAASTDSMRFTFSKVAIANDATLSFQTNYSARALLGTTGSDDFQLKVSPDGSTFYQAFVADHATGNVAFKQLLGAASYTVASLPTSAFNGALAFASNGRKFGEMPTAGSGVVAAYSNGAWRRLSDDSVVVS